MKLTFDRGRSVRSIKGLARLQRRRAWALWKVSGGGQRAPVSTEGACGFSVRRSQHGFVCADRALWEAIDAAEHKPRLHRLVG